MAKFISWRKPDVFYSYRYVRTQIIPKAHDIIGGKDIGPQASLLRVAGNISLVSSARSGQDCYPKGNLFQKGVIAFFSIAGSVFLIAGMWIVFFGIDRRQWSSGWRLGAALSLSGLLIVVGWFSQVIMPLPIALYAEYASVLCGSSPG